MSGHPEHVFCSSRFCVPRELHHELLARVVECSAEVVEFLRADGRSGLEAHSSWLAQCYQSEAEALEHFDTEVDLASPSHVARYLRWKARDWIKAKRPAIQTSRRRPPRRRIVPVEAA